MSARIRDLCGKYKKNIFVFYIFMRKNRNLKKPEFKKTVYIITILLSLSVIANSFSIQQTRKYLYQKCSTEEGKAYILKVADKLPNILGSSPLEHFVLDTNSIKDVQCIRIDKEEIVALVYVLPETHITLNFMDNDKPRSLSFMNNGFFVSTVDLVTTNCKISLYQYEGLKSLEYLPKGEYAWYLGKEGIMLVDRAPAGENTRIIFFEKALDDFPTGNFLLIEGLFVMTDPTKGFRIGGARGDTKKSNNLSFTIEMTVYDKQESFSKQNN